MLDHATTLISRIHQPIFPPTSIPHHPSNPLSRISTSLILGIRTFCTEINPRHTGKGRPDYDALTLRLTLASLFAASEFRSDPSNQPDLPIISQFRTQPLHARHTPRLPHRIRLIRSLFISATPGRRASPHPFPTPRRPIRSSPDLRSQPSTTIRPPDEQRPSARHDGPARG